MWLFSLSRHVWLAFSWLVLASLLSSCAAGFEGDWKRITPTKRGSVVSTTNTAPHGGPVRSVRLIFEYEGDRVRLVSQQPVDVAVTGFDLPKVDRPGYYVESRDKDGRSLARVPARNAFLGSMEVFPERHDQPITRVDVPQPKGAFTVVVPAPDATDHVTVTRIAPGKAVEGVAPGVAPVPEVTDLVSFPLNLNR